MKKSQNNDKKSGFHFPNGDFLNVLKRNIPFSKAMNAKLEVTLGVILLALFAFVIRIFFIQHVDGKSYNEKILKAQNYESKVIPFKRGDILDRNGTYIAKSEKVFRLILDPKSVIQPEEGENKKTEKENNSIRATIEDTSILLHEIFGYDPAEIQNLFWEESTRAYVVLGKGISYEQMTQFEEKKKQINQTIREENKTRKAGDEILGGIRGVWFEDSYVRKYPYNDLACDIIGFTNAVGDEGTGGIEQSYNEDLTGTNGRSYGYLNEETSLERTVKQATNGSDIVSTVDMNIQSIVSRHIARREEEIGSKRTAVIIMNPNSGEILAMATSKGYDLNNPRDLSRYYSEEEINAMDDTVKLDALSNMWRNFSVVDTFEPGSPSKVFTVAAALEENVINGSEHFICNGVQEIQGQPVKCAVRTGHGEIDVPGSLMQSCNIVMMDLASKLGTERFCDYQRVFGFGSRTGIDINGEPDSSNLIHTVENMMPIDLATNSFGQNYNCTMMQMISGFSSAINGGTYYQPHVVKRVIDANGSLKKNIEPIVVRETVSQKTSEFLRESLRRTVVEGTGAAAQIPGYEIGGKTGTAEKYPRGQGNYLVSFIGFAPENNPQVVCYVVIDEPQVEDQAHSTYASSLFAQIMAEVLPAMNIFPNTPTTETNSEQAGLPATEGVQETQPSLKIYATEEFIPRDADVVPGESLPAAETTADSGLHIDPENSVEEPVYQPKNALQTTEAESEIPTGSSISDKKIKEPTAESIEELKPPS